MSAPVDIPFEVAFLARLQRLLTEGKFTSTYKFGVLIGLSKLCVERLEPLVGHHDPVSFTTKELAAQALEVYWPQIQPIPSTGAGATVHLRQNAGRPAQILTEIEGFLRRSGFALGGQPPPLEVLRRERGDEFDRLLDMVEWKLIEMPLPRLQELPSGFDEFIYTIHWTVGDVEPRGGRLRREVRAYQRGAAADFDNRILVPAPVVATLKQFYGLVRDLVEARWVRMVEALNPEVCRDPDLYEHLFGAHRVNLDKVRSTLLDLQDGRCFYCGREAGKVQVDHFLPWFRFPDNRLDNLIAADVDCNLSKRHHLASEEHVTRWHQRFDPDGDAFAGLRETAQRLSWPDSPRATLAAGESLYSGYPDDAQLWQARGRFVGWSRESMLRQFRTVLEKLNNLGPM